MRRPLLCPLILSLSFLSVGATVATTAVASPNTVPGQEIDLKSEIDRSIRWLRSKQSPDGSYGASVKSTAWVLQAMAMSPRAYVRRDGPFVAGALDFLATKQHPETGGIFDKGANELQRSVHSAFAWLALSQFDDPNSNSVRKRVEAFFETPPKADQGKAWDRPRARKEFSQWMSRRKPDGSWDGADGALIVTSEALIALGQCYTVLQDNGPAATSAKRLPNFDDANRENTIASMQRGALFLIAASDDGLWGAPGQPELGVSAMAVGALLEVPAPRPDVVQDVIDKGLQWIADHQDKDGSIHDGKLKNYLTSASVLALAKSGDSKYAPTIERARLFLVALQADEGEGYTDGDLFYGGIGYGGDERPDLSNLQMALEALAAAGTKPGDDSFNHALKFLERTQNRSESNDVQIIEKGVTTKSGNDGGAVYAPGDSKAGYDELADGTRIPRSYGSMTYALLKGFIFAGLPKDDPRMQAAWKWIREHYTLDVNPGFEQSADPTAPYRGLYYYFHTMAKALDLYGDEMVVDGSGRAHAWRAQLSGRLISMQRKDDGSWINENAPSWWEGNPVLATSYALLSLGAALPEDPASEED
ncbi:MAG: squalene-hopene/tetraprenyl-beta-curcumene cyclase [Candidatus Paceibacteria bacterium]|jgi:squalene-hopene/tetraprenyl-beta-curcumene cyclase